MASKPQSHPTNSEVSAGIADAAAHVLGSRAVPLVVLAVAMVSVDAACMSSRLLHFRLVCWCLSWRFVSGQLAHYTIWAGTCIWGFGLFAWVWRALVKWRLRGMIGRHWLGQMIQAVQVVGLNPKCIARVEVLSWLFAGACRPGRIVLR
jgi:hypothetical protein